MPDQPRIYFQNQNIDKKALEGRVEELKEILRRKQTSQLAEFTGAVFEEQSPYQGEFRLPFWNLEIHITYPLFEMVDPHQMKLPLSVQALVLYYFVTANGAPLSNKWVSFADLPDGRMYAQAFQGYSGDEIVKIFGTDMKTFQEACELADGQKMEMADAAYAFRGLPRVPLLVSYWLGDEEFPSACKILFDSAVYNYLPIYACAILGSMLARRIIAPR